MKQIYDYIESLYKGLDDSKEVKEFKEEMKSHLMETVKELQTGGKSEEESVRIAIERFGDERLIGHGLAEVLQVQRLFAKNILRTALAFLLVGFVIAGIVGFIEFNNIQERDVVAQQVLNILGTEKNISAEIKKEIDSMVEPKGDIYQLEAYYIKDNPEFPFSFNPQYNYKKEIISPIWLLIAYKGQAYQNDYWFVQISHQTYEGIAISVLIICIVIYWVLFAIWAIVNAYHQKRLKLLWVLAFSLFNVFGYLIFRLGNKK